MSKQRTTRANHRHSPTAASRKNKGTSAFVELEIIPYVIKDKARREPKPPQTALWLSSTLQTYKNFTWDHYVPSKDHIRYLQTSDCTRNASVHFKNHFSTTSKQFKWECSRNDLEGAWRHAPEDLKATWNGIFQANTNTKTAKASSGKQKYMETPKPISPYANCKPIQAWMPVASTSNAYPDFSGSWSSPPTHFGSPLPNRGVLHGRYSPAPLSGAEVPCYLPPLLNQEWGPPISSGALFPSGYSSPASTISPYSTYSGGSYFNGSPSGSAGGSSALGNGYRPSGFYDQHPVAYDHYFQCSFTVGTHKKDRNESWDPLSHQTRPYPSPPSRDFVPGLSMPVSRPLHTTPQLDVVDHGHPATSQTSSSRGLSHELNTTLLNGSFHEVPRVDLNTDGSSSLPNHGQAFEQWNRFNFFERYPAQTGSSIEHLFDSLNPPVELDPTFYGRSIDASPMPHGAWPAYESFSGCFPETVAALGHHPSSTLDTSVD